MNLERYITEAISTGKHHARYGETDAEDIVTGMKLDKGGPDAFTGWLKSIGFKQVNKLFDAKVRAFTLTQYRNGRNMVDIKFIGKDGNEYWSDCVFEPDNTVDRVRTINTKRIGNLNVVGHSILELVDGILKLIDIEE